MHTLKLTFIFPALALLFPALALAGTQTFTSSGTFTVPAYGTLTVMIIGAGGGGGGGAGASLPCTNPDLGSGSPGGSGSAGGGSAFGSVSAGGGGGGAGGDNNRYSGYVSTSGGSAFSANPFPSGFGGVGGVGGVNNDCGMEVFGHSSGADGTGGGSGAVVSKTFAPGDLTPGSTVSVSVGQGGTGGSGGAGVGGDVVADWYDWMFGGAASAPSGSAGSSGQGGSVTVSWSEGGAGGANSCPNNTAIFDTPGNHTFTVPDGVTSVRVVTVGGGGGAGGGNNSWGSGSGGGCGGAVSGGVVSVSPGDSIAVVVGAGGKGGGTAANGQVGGSSSFGSIRAVGGSWGRNGYYNLYGSYTGGSGGGSGSGGGGNGWPGFEGYSTSGGTAGRNNPLNFTSSGGYCTGGGWSVNPGTYIMNSSWAAGQGGTVPYVRNYYGGGGGGGLIINGSTVSGATGGGTSWPAPGGAGYGGGGGGTGVDYYVSGGDGATGVVYVEWDGGSGSGSCSLSCNVTFDQNPLTGESTTMRWDSTDADLFYINSVGYVSASGLAQVSSPGDYSGTVSSNGRTASCSAILSSGNDQNNLCTPTSQTCQANGNLLNNCGIATSCQYGCSTQTNQCNTTCQPSNVCSASGTKVVNSCTGATVSDCAAQDLTCSGGVCVPRTIDFQSFSALKGTQSFTATGHLQILPPLVRRGDTAQVYWNVVNASACTVTGTNGDGILGSGTGIWNIPFSGAPGKTTSPITAQTTYTLHCTSLPGVLPPFVQESAIINVLPSFQEL